MTNTVGTALLGVGKLVDKVKDRLGGEDTGDTADVSAKTNCSQCGESNRTSAKFCAACGNSLQRRQALVLSGCAKTKQPYVLRFEYQQRGVDEGWFPIEACVVSSEVAQRGGYGRFRAKGAVYGGVPCPYCGARGFYIVHEKFSCLDEGQLQDVPCGWCNSKHSVGGSMQSIDCAMRDI